MNYVLPGKLLFTRVRPTTVNPAKNIVVLYDFPSAQDATGLTVLDGSVNESLRRVLELADVDPEELDVHYVLRGLPEKHEVKNSLVKKDALGLSGPALLERKVGAGLYLDDKDWQRVVELREGIRAAKPDIVIACGAIAALVVTGEANIKRHRGTVLWGAETDCKALITYSPWAVHRQWKFFNVLLIDWLKALRSVEHDGAALPIPETQVFVPETLDEARGLIARLSRLGQRGELCSADIETAKQQMDCIGFSIRDGWSVCIPFWDKVTGENLWSLREEIELLKMVAEYLERDEPKVFQNGLYDVWWLYGVYGIQVQGFQEDTFLMHHVLLPEMERGLGALGSFYTNRPSWKHINKTRGVSHKDKSE